MIIGFPDCFTGIENTNKVFVREGKIHDIITLKEIRYFGDKNERNDMIDIYIHDIKRSLENGCYFSALALALTLPDICGMAEFPNETSVARYIEWYDKYLGIFMAQGKDLNGVENPWLSGEIIYNLRNTFLHTGSPNVMGDKVKEEANQIDRFILVLGDSTVIWDSTIAVDVGHGKVKFKAIIVDVTYLCKNICDCALWFYDKNKEKFQFDFNVITQEEFLKQPVDNAMEGDILAKILNKKLFESGSAMRVVENPNRDIFNSNEETKKKFLNGNIGTKKLYQRKRERHRFVLFSVGISKREFMQRKRRR